jgi:hypothetical protein
MNTSQPIAGETFASGVFASEIEVSSTDEVLPRRRHSATLRGAGFARVPLKRRFFFGKKFSAWNLERSARSRMAEI